MARIGMSIVLTTLFSSACGTALIGEELGETIEIRADAEALVAELTAACGESSSTVVVSVSPDVTEPFVYPDAPLQICLDGLPPNGRFVYGYPWRATEDAYEAVVTGTAIADSSGAHCFNAPRSSGEYLTDAGEALEEHRIELEPGSYLVWANWGNGASDRSWACGEFRAEERILAPTLLSNGDFEADFDTLEWWWNNRGNTRAATDNVLGGNQAGKHVLSSSGPTKFWHDIDDIVAGETYTLAAHLATRDVSSSCELLLQWRDSGGQVDAASSAAAAGTQDWQPLTVESVAPASATYVRVQLICKAGSGEAWWDDATLRAGDCADCQTPTCGDGTCNGAETCASCVVDCGECGPDCGDGTCDATETCDSCPSDCGTCPVGCDDCFYVRPAGASYGSGDGSSYTDAWSGLAAVDWNLIDASDGRLFVCGEHRETLEVGASGEADAYIEIASCTPEYGAAVDDAGTLNQTELLLPEDFTDVGGGLYKAEMSVPITDAPLRNGTRMGYHGRTSGVTLQQTLDALPEHQFFSSSNRWRPCNASTDVYVRANDGDIGQIEVGARLAALDTRGEDYVRVLGLLFVGGSGDVMPDGCAEDPPPDGLQARWGADVVIPSGSDYVEILDCEHGPGGRAGNVGTYVTHVTLDGVFIHDRSFGYYFHGDRTIFGAEPPTPTPETSCSQTVSDVLVNNMVCTDVGRVEGDGGDLECLGFNTTKNITVQNSYFARNGRAFDGANHSSLVSGVVNCNFVVTHNYFHDGGGGMTHNGRDTGTVIAYNIFDGWGRIDSAKSHADTAVWLGGSGRDWMGEMYVLNNLFINGPVPKDDEQASLQILFEEFDVLHVKNNIFYDNGDLPDIFYNPLHSSDDIQIDNNLFYRSDSSSNVVRCRGGDNIAWYTYAEMDGIGADYPDFGASILADPRLQSTTSGPSHPKTLRPGSPAIDAGVATSFDSAMAPDSTWTPLEVGTLAQDDHGPGWELGPYVFVP